MRPALAPALAPVFAVRPARRAAGRRLASRAGRRSSSLGGESDSADGEATLGLFTQPPGCVDELCAAFSWPASLGRLPEGHPATWAPAARARLLGRVTRLWPCIRASLCAGAVQHSADASESAAADAALVAAGGPHVPLPRLAWADVEATGFVACVALGLRAGGGEARSAVDAAFSVLVAQNAGLAERLLVDGGVEAVIYDSLVAAGVHRGLCRLVEAPGRLGGAPERRKGPFRAYLRAKAGGVVAREDGWDVAWAEGAEADVSVTVFNCLFLIHMCTNWRTGGRALVPHCVAALAAMGPTAEELLECAEPQLAPRRRARRRRLSPAPPPSPLPSNAYVSMVVTSMGMAPSRSLSGVRPPPRRAAPPSDAWRLRQRGVAELVAVGVRNGGVVRRLAADPIFIPALVAMASAAFAPVRVQAQAACALYHVAGADMRSMYGGEEEAEGGAGGEREGESPGPRTLSVVVSGSDAGSSSDDEIDLDDVFAGQVGPEGAAFLLGVFDSQQHARRSDPSVVRARLEASLHGGIPRATASLLLAAGAERALVAIVRDCTARTAHARTARGYAAAALAVLSRIDECRPALVAAGAIKPLIAMLEETNASLDFSVGLKDVLLATALPHDPDPMSFDGNWIITPGKPLLAEIAAAALLGLTGRAFLFAAASSPWDGAPSFAEAMLRGVASNFSSFGAPDGEAPKGELGARAVGARRRGHARLLNVLTSDFETACALVEEGAIPPLCELLNQGSELARQALAALAVSPDIVLLIEESGGASSLNVNYGDEQ